jgi:type I restriction enzyme, S subunit
MGSEWREATLGELIRLQRGHDLTEGQRKPGEIPVMGSAGLNGFHNISKANGPGIVVGRSGASFGKVHYSISDYWPHNTALYVTNFLGNDELFTFHFLKTIDFSSYNSGSAQPSLNRNHIYLIPVIIPPLPEQKAIAHILGSLDDKIELNRRMNATLEGMAQALFKSWFVDFDPVIDNAIEAGNPIPEELAVRAEVRRKALKDGTANREVAEVFPAAFELSEEMGWIPVGWEVRPIAEQAHLTMGQSPSSVHYNKDGIGLPFHQGVTNYGERFPKHEQFSTGGNRLAEQGDILFSVRAPVGRINISDCRIIIGRGLSALRHKKNYQGFLVYFLKHTFQKEDSIGSGTIFNAVNKKEMESLPCITPSDGLAEAFDNIVSSLDEKIASNADQTQSLTNLRDALLPKLISGELRIPDAEKFIGEALR